MEPLERAAFSLIATLTFEGKGGLERCRAQNVVEARSRMAILRQS